MNKLDLDYIGDGVYVGHDGYQIWLTLHSHENTEMIALDPSVLNNLIRYAKNRVGFEIKE
jgi:hypothetical protein